MKTQTCPRVPDKPDSTTPLQMASFPALAELTGESTPVGGPVAASFGGGAVRGPVAASFGSEPIGGPLIAPQAAGVGEGGIEYQDTCPVCGFQAYHRHVMTIHLRNHQDPSGQFYLCAQCDYKTRRSNDLRRHIRKHTGERPYDCALCDYSATTSSRLRMHNRMKHSDATFQH